MLTCIPLIYYTADYSFDALRRATNDFRTPAVVRGLFNGTRATERWNDRDYLPRAFGDVEIPVVRDGSVGTLQDDRVVVRIGHFESHNFAVTSCIE